MRPKALCPVGNRALVDHGLDRLDGLVGQVAANIHHGAAALDAHLPSVVHRSFEQPRALGTAGALGRLASWVDGRDVLVTNADAWFADVPDLTTFVDQWDRARVRLLCIDTERGDVDGGGDFGSLRYCGVALMPAAKVAALRPEPSGLYEVSWREEAESGRLDLVVHPGTFIDCGTVHDYLAANLRGSGGGSVIHPTAVIGAGAVVERSVVWEHSEVQPGEVLTDTIRGGEVTVIVR